MIATHDTYLLTVRVLNMTLAAVAAWANFRTAHRVPRRAAQRAVVGTLSAIYVCAYAWLIIFDNQVAWSRVMQGVSLTAWVTVWIWPPLLTVKISDEINAAIRAKLELERERDG